MKTTVEVSDAILGKAKRLASERGVTLRALIEEGLRSVLKRKTPDEPFALQDMSVDGNGLREGIDDGAWDRIIEISYGERGGA